MPSPIIPNIIVRPLRLAGPRLYATSLLTGLYATVAPTVAHADALTISSATTTPVTTAQASNSSAGDITVDSNASVIVTTTGPAVTINSSNAVTNGGSIQSSATTGATGLLIDGTGGISTTLTNNGTIGVTGSNGSGNYGIRIVNGSVTGSIVTGSSSTISVLGTDSYGVSIEAPFTGDIALTTVAVSGARSTAISLTAPLTGNLSLSGSTYAYGADATGLLVAAPLTGAIVNSGTITAGQAATTTTDADGDTVGVEAAPGVAAVHIAANVTGGLLNDRYYVDSDGDVVAAADVTSSDTLVSGTIAGIDGTTALLVAPQSGGSDITVSAVGVSGTDDGYGIVNRGTISSAGTAAGFSATAIKIAGDTTSGAITTIEGGLINQANGSISATVTTGTGVAATATAVEIGANAVVPTIVNKGSLGATASIVTSSDSAASRAIVIDAGATVGSIVNSGTIGATTSTSSGTGGPATAILDQSGTLTSITNSGTIFASGATAHAIDLTAGSQDVTVTNSGTITGDILFGSGDSTYSADSGTLSGTLAYGSGTNLLSLSGTTAFTSPITIATGGTLAVDLSDTSSINFGTSAPTLSSLTASGQSQIIVPISSTSTAISVTGAASFTDESSIRLTITDQPGTDAITVLRAAGGITTDHLSTLISASSVPYLYTLTDYGIDGDALTVTLHQKTGAEAGFSSGMAALFDQSMVAFGNGTIFQTIANLADKASLFAAYRQITPPSYGTLGIRLAQSLQATGTGLIRGRLDALNALPPGQEPDGGRLTPWIQESANILRKSDADNDPGFSSDNFGLSFGADYALSKSLAIGAAATFQWDNVSIDGMTEVSNKPFAVQSQMIDLYAGWHSGPFFVQLVGGYGWNSYDFHRQIDIGSISVEQAAQWKGTQLTGDAIAGLRFKLGRFSIEPSDSLSYVKLRQKGYTTSGGGDFDLTVDGKSDTALMNTARLAVGYTIPAGDESAFGLQLRGGYATQLDKSLSPLTARFLAGGSSFDMATANLRGGSTQVGGGVSFQTVGFYVGLNGDRREEGSYSDTSFSLTARLSF